MKGDDLVRAALQVCEFLGDRRRAGGQRGQRVLAVPGGAWVGDGVGAVGRLDEGVCAHTGLKDAVSGGAGEPAVGHHFGEGVRARAEFDQCLKHPVGAFRRTVPFVIMDMKLRWRLQRHQAPQVCERVRLMRRMAKGAAKPVLWP